MIEIKKEKEKRMNKKILIIIIFVSTFFMFSSTSFSETKEDCSKYSTKTMSGLSKKVRCNRGLPPIKNFFSKLKWKGFGASSDVKAEHNATKKKLACDDYTSKTIAGLIGKLRCSRNK